MSLDWKVLLITLLVAVAWLVATFYYPQTPNSNAGFQAFEQSKDEYIVIVHEVDRAKAVEQVWKYYDPKEFTIAEEYYDKSRKAWLFRIVKKG
jgi:hypothetical protein